MQVQEFDGDLIRRYDTNGPRYTSYPTALQFHEQFDADNYRQQAEASNEDLIPRPLSLYIHIPFCESLCYYCGCNKLVTRHPEQALPYLNALHQEITWQGELFDNDRPVKQLHLGGGTPTYINDIQLYELLQHCARHFNMPRGEDREWSIEVDPRTVDPDRINNLAKLGFNRLSLGVQDFNPSVQAAVNRIQSVEDTAALVEAARKSGFRSVSFDLIYGLPCQSKTSFAETLEQVLAMRPDRLSIYNYAHMPQLFKAQKLINEEDLPSAEEKLAIMGLCLDTLIGAGYQYIGMDHFALPDDDLVTARDDGTLQRNFQGYSTRGNCDLVGLGVSSISQVHDSLSQNIKHLKLYQECIENGRMPVERGLIITEEDRLRRQIIQNLMCQGRVSFKELQNKFDIDPKIHLSSELFRLRPMIDDGLVNVSASGIEVTDRGHLLLRNIAMVFDEYLQEKGDKRRFSKVI